MCRHLSQDTGQEQPQSDHCILRRPQRPTGDRVRSVRRIMQWAHVIRWYDPGRGRDSRANQGHCRPGHVMEAAQHPLMAVFWSPGVMMPWCQPPVKAGSEWPGPGLAPFSFRQPGPGGALTDQADRRALTQSRARPRHRPGVTQDLWANYLADGEPVQITVCLSAGL